MSELLVVDEDPDPLSSSDMDTPLSGDPEHERQQVQQLCVAADIILRSHPDRQGDVIQKTISLQDASLRRMQSPLQTGVFAYFFNLGEMNNRSYYTWTTNDGRVRACTKDYTWEYTEADEVRLSMESALQLPDESIEATKDRNLGQSILAKLTRS